MFDISPPPLLALAATARFHISVPGQQPEALAAPMAFQAAFCPPFYPLKYPPRLGVQTSGSRPVFFLFLLAVDLFLPVPLRLRQADVTDA